MKLTEKQIGQLIDEWDKKSTKDIAKAFGVSVSTIYRYAKDIRGMNHKLCPTASEQRKKNYGKSYSAFS